MTSVTLSTPGAGNWTVPGGVTSIQIDCIGGGVGGTGNNFFPPKGGGAPAFARKNAATVTPGQVIPYHVGAGYTSPDGIAQGSGEPSWMGTASILDAACLCFAEGAGAYTGGAAGNSKGDTKFSGGDGGHPVINGKGPAAGGAAGLQGAGSDGTATTGGAADNSTVPGGVYPGGGLPGGNGSSGTDLPDGSGSGSGGSFGTTGGNGGLYGGAGAGGNNAGASGGIGRSGLIVITYTQAPFAKSQGHIFG